MPTKKILLCTDFSENSDPPRRLALEYAKALDASLVIVHVVETWAGYPAYEFRVPVDLNEVARGIQGAVSEDLDKLAAECAELVPVDSTHCRIGVPADEIVSVAQDEAVDLIVMGTHGWTGFKSLLLGSVAENVLRTASCPVLVVRSPKSQ